MKLFGTRTLVPAPPTGPQGDGAPPAPEALAEMSFLDHLEELRWSLIKGLAAVVVACVVVAFFSQWIIDTVLLGPAKEGFFMYKLFGIEAKTLVLQNRTITGQFFAHIGTIAAVGVVMGSPLLVYFLWRFIEPGLYPTEKKGMRFASVFASFFFLLGIAFGYFVITPLALQFFAGYQLSDQILNEFDITRYFGMVTWWSFSVGLLFELPVVIYFLAKLGILTSDLLRRSRRWAVIIAFVLGAIFTPPDPVSQTLVALPMLGLFELSIYIAKVVERRRERELKAALGRPGEASGEAAP